MTNIEKYRIIFSREKESHISFLSISDTSGFSPNEFFLTSNEKQQLKSFTGTRKIEFLLSRYLIKRSILNYLPNSSFENTEISSGVFGQPIVTVLNSSLKLGTSISHKKELVGNLLFHEKHPLGLDIEYLCPNKEKIFFINLTSMEKKIGLNTMYSTVIWTAKEALSKVLKCGLTVPFSFFEVSNLKYENGMHSGEFHHFKQYKFFSFEINNHIITVVHPRKSSFQIQNIK